MMRVAILETVKTTGGFEQEFDRLIIDELKKQGHSPELYLPENSSLPVEFGVPIKYMSGGASIDYEGVGKVKKIWRSFQRELRRVKWFDSAYERAVQGEIDAIIITTATYRYLRSLHKSQLRKSPIPIIFIFLGVNPQEKPKFVAQARKCIKYPNIKLKITSLRNDFKGDNLSNVEIIKPPVLVPPGLEVNKSLSYKEPIKIGFFGHYRKGEKNIEDVLKVFISSKMSNKIKLIVQAAPTDAEDIEELNIIMKKYSQQSWIAFINGKLQGRDWYDALKSVDVIFLPYSNNRYLYNWSAVYFNALGLYKPVIVTDILNPEILQKYDVGIAVDLQDILGMSTKIDSFLHCYEDNISTYQKNLALVNKEFGTDVFVQNVLR